MSYGKPEDTTVTARWEKDKAPTQAISVRMARCSCGRTVPSSPDLAFFEDCGPGSKVATGSCVCGYYECAHDPAYMAKNVSSNRRTVVEQGKCGGFRARGPLEDDRYYCGCWGWD